MRESFKKGLAGVLGAYTGLVIINYIGDLLGSMKKSEETETKQEVVEEEA